MSKFLSPSALFALAALLIALPGLLQLNARHPPPRVDLRLFPHPVGVVPGANSTPLVTVNASSGAFIVRPWVPRPLAAAVFGSIPIFALVYAAWPRAFGRSLNPKPGRWHVVLASLPIVLAPIAGFIALPLAGKIALSAIAKTGRFDADRALANVLLVQAGVGFVVAGLWVAGLIIFALSARTTLRRGNHGE